MLTVKHLCESDFLIKLCALYANDRLVLRKLFQQYPIQIFLNSDSNPLVTYQHSILIETFKFFCFYPYNNTLLSRSFYSLRWNLIPLSPVNLFLMNQITNLQHHPLSEYPFKVNIEILLYCYRSKLVSHITYSFPIPILHGQ